MSIPVGALELELMFSERVSIEPDRRTYHIAPEESWVRPVDSSVPLTLEEEEFMGAYQHDAYPLDIIAWPRTQGGISVSLPYTDTSRKAIHLSEGLDVRIHASAHPALTSLGNFVYAAIGDPGASTPATARTPHNTARDAKRLIVLAERLPDVAQEAYTNLNQHVPEFLRDLRTRQANNPLPPPSTTLYL